MPVTAASLIAEISVRGASQAKADLENVGTKAKEAQTGLKGIAQSALGTAAGFAGFQLASMGVSFLKDQVIDTVKAALDQQQVVADTVTTLQSMGSASGQTAKSIGDFADSMTQVTKFSDDVIQHGENVMLTFGNIGKNIFPQATTAAMNLSTKLGTDLQSSVTMVGKALDNPIQGLTALSRVGVSFSEQEKASIKTMMEHHDVMGAQKVIMSELNKQYGGLAVAAGQTTAGALQTAENRFGLLKEKIGTAVIPILASLATIITTQIIPFFERLANTVMGIVQWFQKHQAVAILLAGALAGLGVAILASLVPSFIAWAAAAWAAAAGTIAATWPILAIGVAIGLVVAGIILAIKHWGAIMDWIKGAIHTVTSAIGGFFSGVGTTIHNIVESIKGAFASMGSKISGVWSGMVGVVKGAINSVIDAINSFIRFIDGIQIHIPSIGIGPVHTPAFDWSGLQLPTLPHLQLGGYIQSGGLAMLHAGERVIPASGLAPASVSSGGGAPIHIKVDVYLDGQRMGHKLMGPIVQEIRTSTGVKF